MKKIFILTIVLLSILTACGKEKSSGNVLEESWETIEKKAEDQTVNIYMWGGSRETNNYIDKIAAPKLLNENKVTINRVPISDIKDIINKLIVEKKAGKNPGSIDVLWINGENFREAKENGILLGDINSIMPAFDRYVNKSTAKYDFGEPVEGLEAPWGEAQFVFITDSVREPLPPKSAEELKEWVMRNPGRFTYPAMPDFTGSAFLRHLIYELTGGVDYYLKDFDEEETRKKLKPVWDYLNEIKPYLWREGETYPESSEKLNQLFSNGEVDITMSYNPSTADLKIKNGEFPSTAKTYLFDKGTIFNNHYLTIPFNAPNKEAALVTINKLISPYLQIEKAKPEILGDRPILDLSKLNEEQKKHFSEIKRGPASVTAEELAAKRVPEAKAVFVDFFEKEWTENVANK